MSTNQNLESRIDEGYKIRRLHPQDWVRVKKDILFVEEKSFREDIRWDGENIEFTATNVKALNYVLEDSNNRIVGYLLGSPSLDIKERSNTMYVESIAVLSEHRGKGLGKRLLDSLVQNMPEEYTKIKIHCINDRIAKIAEEVGFVKVSLEKEWFKGVNAWYMELNHNKK